LSIEFRREWFTPEMCRAEPDKWFVFGDNVKRVGKGGQAIIRDEPNAIGIITKKAPNNLPESFLTDKQYLTNCRYIVGDLQTREYKLICGDIVVFPVDGVGTGRANLPTKAPSTYVFLRSAISSLCNTYGVTNKFEEI
jgi:hypothetical protein